MEPYSFTPYSRRLAESGFAGRRIRKVTVHGGFTCPNLDGTRGRGGCTYSGAYAPVARLRALYEETLAFPGVVGLAVGTRPDCFSPECAELLDELLARDHAAGIYRPLERDAYVEGVVDVLERIPPEVGVQRFTGDAPADMLVAPLWCREKGALEEALIREFRRRGSCQGARLARRDRLAARPPEMPIHANRP